MSTAPDPKPVPLDEIERLADEATEAQSGPLDLTDAGLSKVEVIGRFYNAADPSTVRALCEALRIAVEGLDRVERWYVCKNVGDDDGDFITCRGFTDDSTGWCGWCCALDAIEAVSELVDLGGTTDGE